jgi:iron(III) transport system permease protein
VAVALVFVLVADRLISGLGPTTRTAGSAGWPSRRGRRSRIWLVAVTVMVALTTVGPLVMLVLTALTRAVGLAPTPANWTLAHFKEALAGANLAAFGRSLLLSGLAATLIVMLGSLVTSLRGARYGRPLRAIVLLTFALPGSTLAVAVLLAYGAALRDTLLIILIAYLSKLWGLGHRVVEGAADAIAPDFYRAARASGASAPAALRTVLGPIMSPALLGAWLLVFVFAFHELTMSSLLYGPGSATLAVVVLNLQQLGDVSTTAALSVLLTIPVLVLAVPMVILSRRGHRNPST